MNRAHLFQHIMEYITFQFALYKANNNILGIYLLYEQFYAILIYYISSKNLGTAIDKVQSLTV